MTKLSMPINSKIVILFLAVVVLLVISGLLYVKREYIAERYLIMRLNYSEEGEVVESLDYFKRNNSARGFLACAVFLTKKGKVGTKDWEELFCAFNGIDSDGVNYLGSEIKNSDVVVRRCAVYALGEISSSVEIIYSLIPAINDKDDVVRSLASEAINKINGRFPDQQRISFE